MTDTLELEKETSRGPSGLAGYDNIHEDARKMLDWLIVNLGTGALKKNVRGAMVHFVDEGHMFLVSPIIFKEYAKFRGDYSKEGWLTYQQALTVASGKFERALLGLPTDGRGLALSGADRRYLHRYQITGRAQTGTGRQPPTLTGMLIPAEIVRHMLTPAPATNPLLERIRLDSKPIHIE